MRRSTQRNLRGAGVEKNVKRFSRRDGSGWGKGVSPDHVGNSLDIGNQEGFKGKCKKSRQRETVV